MEVILQDSQRWRGNDSYYLEFDAIPDCPYCGTALRRIDQTHVLECVNDQCAYLCNPVTQEIEAGLIEQGYDRLRAAQVTALYSVDETEPVTTDRFSVKDESSANWVLRKMAETQDEINGIQQMISDELARVALRGESLLRPLKRNLEFFEAAFGTQLRDWVATELEGKKKRSVGLLHGTIGFRKSPDSLVVVDEEATVAWAESEGRNDLIRKSISKTATKKWMAEVNATEIPGANLVTGEDTFYIKPEAL